MTTIRLRRGTTTQWTTANPILADGELGWDSTAAKFKMGNGTSNWAGLPYFLDAALNGKANTSHTHSATDINGGTLPDARLPTRLGINPRSTTDWNTAIQTGWYMGSGAANAPTTAWFMGTVIAHNNLWVTQTVHGFTADSAADTNAWRRNGNDSAGVISWQPWYRIQLSQAEQDARYASITALNAKANLASPTFTGTVGGITKSMVGLPNVDNTADSAKPVSTAQQTALNGKVNTSAIGVANGVAGLGADGKVPSGQLPPAVDSSTFQEKQTNYQPEIITNPFRMYGPKGTKLNLPSHIPGNTNGEATHPSVVFRAEGWGNGAYPYWMAVTPYQGAADSMEDPNVLCSRDGITWVVPPGVTNPLDDAPGSPAAYNSDTEIAFGPDNALYVFWRNLDPNATGNEEKIYYRRSTDGSTWESKVLVYQSNQNTIRLLSPTIMYEDGAWTMWAVDIVTTPDRIVRLRSNTNLPSWAGGWSAPSPITYTNPQAYQDNKGPWHVAVTKAYGRYHMLVNDNRLNSPPPEGDLVYLTSRDGIVWTSGVNPCLPRVQAGQHDMMYRATMIPAVERGVQGFRVWYGALSYYTVPQVWAVYRTFISDAPHSLRGEVTVTLAAANGSVPSGAQAAITFDPPFKDNPDIVLTTNSTLLGLAYDQLTGNGFVMFAENFTAYAANSVKVRWTATEPY